MAGPRRVLRRGCTLALWDRPHQECLLVRQPPYRPAQKWVEAHARDAADRARDRVAYPQLDRVRAEIIEGETIAIRAPDGRADPGALRQADAALAAARQRNEGIGAPIAGVLQPPRARDDAHAGQPQHGLREIG